MRQLQHPTWRYLTSQEQLAPLVKKQDERIERILGDVQDDDTEETEEKQPSFQTLPD